jgi:hypothetical protein
MHPCGDGIRCGGAVFAYLFSDKCIQTVCIKSVKARESNPSASVLTPFNCSVTSLK